MKNIDIPNKKHYNEKFSSINESKNHNKLKIDFANFLEKSGYKICIEPTPDMRQVFLEKYGIRDRVCECVPDIIAVKPGYDRPFWIEIQMNGPKKFTILEGGRIRISFFYLEVYTPHFNIYLHLMEGKIEQHKAKKLKDKKRL